MLRHSDIIREIEQFAPPALQEDFDNTGLQCGNAADECRGVLICVDATPEIVDEAVAMGANLIITHHPLIFRAIKRVTPVGRVGTTLVKALQSGITVYSSHTATDSARGGVSWEMARMLGLTGVATLDRQSGRMMKLVTMVPTSHVEKVREAVFSAGAGALGDYDSCSYAVEGEGTFRALDGANPFVGDRGELHREKEARLEVVMPSWLQTKVETALREAHPYEEPAYDFIALANAAPYSGLGIIGDLTKPLDEADFVALVKRTFGSPVVRTTRSRGKKIARVGLCGGAGIDFVPIALALGADAYICSDTKYNFFLDYADSLFLVDIGHFESENCTKNIFYRIISEKFVNFAVRKSSIEENPINYL